MENLMCTMFGLHAVPSNMQLKLFQRMMIVSPLYAREKQMYSKINHPNLISYIPNAKFYDRQFECNFIMTEFAPFGDFYDLVGDRALEDERILRTYFHQVVDAVEYLHSQGIAHLDLKLENILLGKRLSTQVN